MAPVTMDDDILFSDDMIDPELTAIGLGLAKIGSFGVQVVQFVEIIEG